MKLGEAKVCVECEEIVAASVQICPSCTCTTFFYCAQTLNQQGVKNENHD